MSVFAVISTPIEPVPLSALQTPMTVSRDTQASSQVSVGAPGSCMALQEGQVTRTVRPLRPEGRAMAWRPGQDVVLSGREASPITAAPFHVTLCGKSRGLALTGGCPPCLGRPSAAGPCVIVWPSLQPRPAYRGLVPASLGRILGTRAQPGPGARAHRCLWTLPSDALSIRRLGPRGQLACPADTASVPLTCPVSLEQEKQENRGKA